MRTNLLPTPRIEAWLYFVAVMTTLFTGAFIWDGPVALKTFSFCIVVPILAVMCINRLYTVSDIRINAIDFCFGCFVAYIVVHSATAGWLVLHEHVFVEWIGLTILYVFLRVSIQYGKLTLDHLQVALLISGIVQLAWGNIQLYGLLPSYNDYFKITGSFANPNPFSCYVGMIFPIAICNLLFGDDSEIKLLRYLSFLYLALFIVTIPIANSRTAWVGSVMVVLISGYRRFASAPHALNFFRSSYAKVFGGLLFVSALGALGYGLYFHKKASADGRILIWKIAGSNIDKPVFGNGSNSFAKVYNVHQAEYFGQGHGSLSEEAVADYVPYAFNDYLQISIERGFIGLALFLSVVLFCINRSLGSRSGYAFQGMIIFFVIAAFFNYMLDSLPIKILLISCIAAISSMSIQSIKLDRRILKIVFLFVVIPGSIIAFVTPIMQFSSYRHWLLGYKYQLGGATDLALQHYSEVSSHLKENPKFLQSYGKTMSLAGHYQQSNLILEKALKSNTDPVMLMTIGFNYQQLADFERAEDYYLLAVNISPSKLYPKFQLANLYFGMKENEKFIAIANQILSSNPKVESMAVDQIKGQIARMMVELNPSFQLGTLNLGSMKINK
jgi:tetratricopeptide (TPR) repeat protein